MIHSKYVIVKAIDAITLLGKLNHQISFERKGRLRNALPKNYKTIFRQNHSGSKQFLGDDLADHVKKAKATHPMKQSISDEGLRVSSSSSSSTSFTQTLQRLAPVPPARLTSIVHSPRPDGIRSSSPVLLQIANMKSENLCLQFSLKKAE